MRRLLFLVAATLLAAPARAQTPGFEATHFHPSDTTGGYFAVDGASVAPHLGFGLALWSQWAHRVLVLRDASGAVPSGGEVLGQQVALDLIGSFALWERVELGIDLPYVPRQTIDDTLVGLTSTPSQTGFGDLRIDLKVRALAAELRPQHHLLFAIAAGLRVPTGDATSFLGESGVVGHPRLVLEWRHPRASAAINLGAVVRGTRTFGDLLVGSQLSLGAAARVVAGAGFELMAELRSLVGVPLPDGQAFTARDAPVELDGGVVYRAPFGLAISVAAGGGLTRGYGEPDARVILGVTFSSPTKYGEFPPPPPPPPPPAAPPPAPPPASDRDGDGVPDDRDRCPDQAGSAANDGCPDVDSDGDGLVDRLDKCPFEPEIYNGHDDDDGCPDAGAPILDVAVPNLTPHVPFDGAKLEGNGVWKLLDVVSHLMIQHPEWPHVTVTCSYGRSDPAGECERRAEAVRSELVRDFAVRDVRLGTLSTVNVDRKHGFVIAFQIDDKIGP